MPPDDESRPRRKRRTREHILEDLSENHLERKVLLCGHILRRPERDYGVDVTMFHFADDGSIENGEVRFQLKATDSLKTALQGSAVVHPVKTGDLHYWSLEIYPFILVVYDGKADAAYWLDVKEYVAAYPDQVDARRRAVNVRIPAANKLTEQAVDAFRRKSLEVVSALRSQGGFPDVPRESTSRPKRKPK